MGAGVDEGADRVTHASSTVRVKLATIVALRNVHLGEIADTGDLDVGWGLGEVNTLERAVGDEASATARLEAPRDNLGLHLTHGANGRRCPQAEVLLLGRRSEQVHSNVTCEDKVISRTFKLLSQTVWHLDDWLEPVPH